MNYIVTGGGTGGHLYPGIEIAKELAKKGNVTYIASKNGIDSKLISQMEELPFKVEYWNLRGFQRKLTISNIFTNIATGFKLISLLIKSNRMISTLAPTAVIGVGGYISFPICFVAAKRGVKVIIHEQNSYPGVTNVQLAKHADKVCISYEVSQKYFPSQKIVYSSNPRAQLAQKYANRKLEFQKELGLNPNLKYVLVLGGSLGAEKMNDVIVSGDYQNSEYTYILVTGEKYYESYRQSENDHLKIYPYLQDVLKYMASSDIIVTRAGATTLLEAIYMEKLVIACPSPNVVADHQTKNAQELVDGGMISMLAEDQLSVANLQLAITEAQQAEQQRISKMREFATIDSLQVIQQQIGE